MTVQDRTEVREMIHGILSGWQAQTTAQNDVTNASLDKIEKHLVRINGSIASHEKIISANLPHNVSLCPQEPIIKEIRDKIISDTTVEKTVKELRTEKRLEWAKWLQTGMFIIGAIALIYTAYNTHRNNKVANQIETRVESLGEPVIVNPRGAAVPLPEGYKLKMWGKDTI